MQVRSSAVSLAFKFDSSFLKKNALLHAKFRSNEEEKRKRITMNIATTKGNLVAKEFCHFSFDAEKKPKLVYFYIFSQESNGQPLSVMSELFQVQLKNGIPQTIIPWSPIFCTIRQNKTSIVVDDEKVKSLFQFVKNTNNPELKKQLSFVNTLERNENEGMVFFVNPNYVVQATENEQFHLLESKQFPFIKMNNILTKDFLETTKKMFTENSTRSLFLEQVARKNIYPTFVYTPPLIGLIEYIGVAHSIKNVFFQKDHPLKNFLTMISATQSSIQPFITFEIYMFILKNFTSVVNGGEDKDKNEKTESIKKHFTKFQEEYERNLISLVEWHHKELWDKIETADMKLLFFEKKFTNEKEEIITPLAFAHFVEKYKLSVDRASKIVTHFNKHNVEYTTRMLHLYEVMILKLTGTEKFYDDEDEEEEANSKNEKLYWPNFEISFASPVNNNEIASYFNFTNPGWRNLLSPAISSTMPQSIIEFKSIFSSPHASHFATNYSHILEHKTWIICRKIMEIKIFLEKRIIKDKKIVELFSAEFLSSIKSHIETLDQWEEIFKTNQVKEEEIMDIAFVYLLFLDMSLEKTYFAKTKRFE